MVRKCSWLSVLILLLVSTGAQALGLGDIHLHSALNQNLKADIDLLSVEKGGIADIRVTLASPEAFERAGVERTFLLSRLRFKAERLPDGSAVLHVTTLEPVREPFLNFLIEANWPKGKLVREYTVLLDPPVTLERKPEPVETPKVSPELPPPPKMVETPPPVAEPKSVPQPKPKPEPKPEPAPEPKPEPAPIAAPTPAKAEPSSASAVAAEDVAWAGDTITGDYSVVRGDTLWGIVTRSRIDGVSDKQLMMAIYHANRKAFFGNNINNLKAGEILRIPERDDALAIEIADANSQYREHVDIWMASKREAAPVVVEEEVAPPAEEQVAGVEDEAAAEQEEEAAVAEEEAAPAKEEETAVAEEEAAPVEQEKPADEVATEKVEEVVAEDELKIATARPEGEGEAGPSEGDALAETKARLEQELLLAQEEVESAKQEGVELQSRVDDLEGQMGDLERLIALKSDQLAQLQAQAAGVEEELAVPPAEVETGAEEAPAVATEEESAEPPVEVEAVAEEAVPPAAEGEAPGIEVAPLTPPAESQISEIEAEPIAPLPVEGEPPVAEVEAIAPAAPEEAEPPVTEVEPISPPPSAESEPPVSAVKPIAPPPPVESAPPAAEVKPVAPPPARTRPEPPEEPGFFAGLLGGTSMVAIGGGVLVLLLLLLLIMRRRSGGDGGNFEESILLDSSRSMDSTESTLEEVVEGQGHTEDTSFLSDFSPSDIDALQDETGEVDPLSEADVYISYGRYQQAEDLIRQAIDKDPSRHLLQHKLFEILYALKDGDGFVKLADASAGTAVETNDDAAWSKVLSMGKTLVPDHPLFAGAEPLHGAAEPVEDEHDDLDDFDLDGIAAELDAEEAAGLATAGADLGQDQDVSAMDAIEETTLNIGEMAADDASGSGDEVDDLDLSGLDDDSEMLVEMSAEDDPDASILTDLSESELVSLDVDEAGEVDTKIDLARAYMDMGDPDGAKDILNEVLAEGNDSQKAEAQKLKDQLS